MGIGTSIFLIAVGAILYYAVEFDIEGIRETTVGAILLIIGIIGLAISLLYQFWWADCSRRREIVDEYPPREREYPARDRYRDRY